MPSSAFRRRERSASRAAGALLTALATFAVGLSLAACGSSTSSGSSGSSGPGAAGTSSSARYQARLNLAKCLRSQGINVPDPSANGGPAAGGGGEAFRALRDLPQAKQQAIRQACRKYFAQASPFANLTPAQRAQFQQTMVKFAECMRSHGVNIPDPTAGGPGGGGGIRRAFGSVDRNSPTFQSALKACQGVRPNFFRGGPGGGPGGAPAGAPNA